MKRIALIVASGLTVAGCASWSVGDLIPNFSGPTTGELTLVSDPPGSDARISTGQGCRTPCKLMLPYASGDFTVTFSNPGRIPQVVPVVIRSDARVDPATGVSSRFDPNPVTALLDPGTLPPAKKKKGPKRAKAAKRPPGAVQPPPPADQGPPPADAPPPGSPWPPPPR